MSAQRAARRKSCRTAVKFSRKGYDFVADCDGRAYSEFLGSCLQLFGSEFNCDLSEYGIAAVLKRLLKCFVTAVVGVALNRSTRACVIFAVALPCSRINIAHIFNRTYGGDNFECRAGRIVSADEAVDIDALVITACFQIVGNIVYII